MALNISISKQLTHFNLELDLHCPSGELLAIIGPSGSGKTTAIRILAGLERPDHGLITLHNRTLCDLESTKPKWIPTQNRKLGYVFQEASLFPHLSVRDNIGFGCKDRQRVAFAQALAPKPELLLLDEPFSALDIATRRQLCSQLIMLKKKINIPMILVTHDLEEASLLGDQVIALEQGQINSDWLARNTALNFSTEKNTHLDDKRASMSPTICR